MSDVSSKKAERLPKPSPFLLADENWEDHDYRLKCLVEDFKPADALEYRQLELIVRCDIDIDRQYRFIAQHLNPLSEPNSQGAQMLADWHKFAMQRANDMNKEEESQAEPAEETLLQDESLTPMIAQRYAQRRELMSIHQREIAASHRRRRQEVNMLNELQDRRRRKHIPDAELVRDDV